MASILIQNSLLILSLILTSSAVTLFSLRRSLLAYLTNPKNAPVIVHQPSQLLNLLFLYLLQPTLALVTFTPTHPPHRQLSLLVLYCTLHLVLFIISFRRYYHLLDGSNSRLTFTLSYLALLMTMLYTLGQLYEHYLENPYLLYRLLEGASDDLLKDIALRTNRSIEYYNGELLVVALMKPIWKRCFCRVWHCSIWNDSWRITGCALGLLVH